MIYPPPNPCHVVAYETTVDQEVSFFAQANWSYSIEIHRIWDVYTYCKDGSQNKDEIVDTLYFTGNGKTITIPNIVSEGIDSVSFAAQNPAYQHLLEESQYVWDYAVVTGTATIPAGWQTRPGSGWDVSVGANGTPWVIGTDPKPASNFGIHKWNGSNWAAVDGFAVRIAVDPNGQPWVVNSIGDIWRRIDDTTGWVPVAGGATDLGIGANGTVWKIGNDANGGGGYGIHRWNGSWWTQGDGAATRIAVGPDGWPWVVNAWGGIYRRVNDTIGWVTMPGSATDIGIGANGTVWVIGVDPEGNDYGIHRWNGTAWEKVTGSGVEISVDPDGQPWVIKSTGAILKLN